MCSVGPALKRAPFSGGVVDQAENQAWNYFLSYTIADVRRDRYFRLFLHRLDG